MRARLCRLRVRGQVEGILYVVFRLFTPSHTQMEVPRVAVVAGGGGSGGEGGGGSGDDDSGGGGGGDGDRRWRGCDGEERRRQCSLATNTPAQVLLVCTN